MGMTLTRRDRAAMRLAYELLLRKECDTIWAYVALEVGDATIPICNALDMVRTPDGCSERILRARLALLLRAMLRADACRCSPAGIWGYHRGCVYETHYGPWFEDGNTSDRDEWLEPLRYTALWERAPMHKEPGK